jgi:hypothetical protein
MTPHWAMIVDSSVEVPGRSERLEGFDVALYADDGQMLEWLQYDTLPIALDQAREILGIRQGAWEVCRIDLIDPARLDTKATTSAE